MNKLYNDEKLGKLIDENNNLRLYEIISKFNGINYGYMITDKSNYHITRTNYNNINDWLKSNIIIA